jgi:hypothetical protein
MQRFCGIFKSKRYLYIEVLLDKYKENFAKMPKFSKDIMKKVPKLSLFFALFSIAFISLVQVQQPNIPPIA